MEKFIQFFGWCGAGAILLAYSLVSFEILEPTNLAFQLLNGLGALGIVLVSWRKRDYQPAVLNIIWAIIAVVAMVQILLR